MPYSLPFPDILFRTVCSVIIAGCEHVENNESHDIFFVNGEVDGFSFAVFTSFTVILVI